MNLFTRGVVGLGFGAVAGVGLGLGWHEGFKPSPEAIKSHVADLGEANQDLVAALGNDACAEVAIQAVVAMEDKFKVKGDVPNKVDEVLATTCPHLSAPDVVSMRPAYRAVDEAAKQVRVDKYRVSPESKQNAMVNGALVGALAGYLIGSCPYIGRKQMVKNALIKFAD